MKNHHGMTFPCDRSWEAMAPMDGGRFCAACEKPVIDFTGWSREELIAYFRSGARVCGAFTREQIDPDLVPLPPIGAGLRRGVFASLAVLAMATANAQEAPRPPATDQVIHGADTSRVRGTDHITSHPRKPWPVDEVRDQPKRPEQKRRLYLSKRFPFLHISSRTPEPRYIGFF